MKAIIVDDELTSITHLEAIIARAVPEIKVLASYTRPLEGIEMIKALQADILFLDINMPGLNGFELLEQLRGSGLSVIVTSNSERHAFSAIKYGVTDYLVKPIKADELKEAIAKLSVKESSASSQQLEMLMQYFKPQQPKVRRIALTASDHLVFVETNDILYCESDSNYTTFFLAKGEKVVISKTLKDVEELLQRDDFFRIHASYLVNMKHVVKFTRGDTGQVVMSNQQHLPMSRKRKDEFFEKFSKL